MKKIQVMIGIIFAAVFLSACAQKEPDSAGACLKNHSCDLYSPLSG